MDRCREDEKRSLETIRLDLSERLSTDLRVFAAQCSARCQQIFRIIGFVGFHLYMGLSPLRFVHREKVVVEETNVFQFEFRRERKATVNHIRAASRSSSTHGVIRQKIFDDDFHIFVCQLFTTQIDSRFIFVFVDRLSESFVCVNRF